jgi:hypothetical protein
MPQDGPIDPAPPALASLHRSFAMALAGVKHNTAGQTNSALKKAKTASKKREIIERHFAAWREGCADAIRKFFPQYIALGLAYPEEVKSDLVKWAVDSAWIPLCTQCGVSRDGDLFPHRSHRSHSVVWWLSVAVEGNTGVNVPGSPAWRAPDWLAKDPAQTDKLIADWSARLSARFCGVLSEESESARVTIAIATAPSAAKPEPRTKTGSPSNGLLRKYRSEVKKAILIQLTQNPSASAVEICRAFDASGEVELPENWRSAPADRLFCHAYHDPKRKPRIEKEISKVRVDLHKSGLLTKR